MTDAIETVTIPKTEYDQMKSRISKLDALESGGVDDWWYGESLAEWYGLKASGDYDTLVRIAMEYCE